MHAQSRFVSPFPASMIIRGPSIARRVQPSLPYSAAVVFGKKFQSSAPLGPFAPQAAAEAVLDIADAIAAAIRRGERDLHWTPLPTETAPVPAPLAAPDPLRAPMRNEKSTPALPSPPPAPRSHEPQMATDGKNMEEELREEAPGADEDATTPWEEDLSVAPPLVPLPTPPRTLWLRTAPFDARFPSQNQTRHCWCAPTT